MDLAIGSGKSSCRDKKKKNCCTDVSFDDILIDTADDTNINRQILSGSPDRDMGPG